MWVIVARGTAGAGAARETAPEKRKTAPAGVAGRWVVRLASGCQSGGWGIIPWMSMSV